MWLHYARFVRIARFVYLCAVEQRPKIAVVSNNSLMNIGLKSIIERIIPMVEVVVFVIKKRRFVEKIFFENL